MTGIPNIAKSKPIVPFTVNTASTLMFKRSFRVVFCPEVLCLESSLKHVL